MRLGDLFYSIAVDKFVSHALVSQHSVTVEMYPHLAEAALHEIFAAIVATSGPELLTDSAVLFSVSPLVTAGAEFEVL